MFNPGDGVIVVGDATTHGGRVITGQQNCLANGKPVAVVGDKVTCPHKSHGLCSIVQGHPTITVNGKPVAFHGSVTSCGAKLISSGMGVPVIGRPSGIYVSRDISSPSSAEPSRYAPRSSRAESSFNARPPSSTVEPDAIEPVFARSRMAPKQPTLPPLTRREPIDNAGQAVLLSSPARSGCEAPECTALAASAGVIPVRAGTGMTPLQPITSPSLWSSMASGASLLFRSANVPATLALVFKPTDLGDGTLITPEDLRGMSSAKTRLRFWVFDTPQGTVANGIHIAPGSAHEHVPVAHAQWTDGTRQQMDVVVNGITLTWTPNDGPRQAEPTALPIDPGASAAEITIYPIPEAEQGRNIVDLPTHTGDWRDAIITFPADSGMAPLYIVLKEGPRQEAGVVTGYGAPAGADWLSAASSPDGAPIPSQVADSLRGREFSSFDRFREALWGEIGKNQPLLQSLNQRNRELTSRGRSPFTRKSDRVGGRRRMEIHHLELVSQGGDVYNIDNMRIMTPRTHIDAHRSTRGSR